MNNSRKGTLYGTGVKDEGSLITGMLQIFEPTHEESPLRIKDTLVRFFDREPFDDQIRFLQHLVPLPGQLSDVGHRPVE